MNRPTVGLVLSGGGARGMAHIGVLRVFEREGIPIDYLAGTSMGGLLAAGYASGYSAAEIEEIAITKTRNHGMLRFADLSFPNGGVIRGKRLLEFFIQLFGERTFSDLNLPLALVAVDLNSHREIIFQDGPVAIAVRATISYPGIFMPLELNGLRLVDGGILNNLPVDAAVQMGADIVIAVDIGLSSQVKVSHWTAKRCWIPKSISTTLDTLSESLYTLRIIEQENKLRQFPPAVIIQPDLAKDINSFAGYDRVEESVKAGALAAEDRLDEIKALLCPR